MSRALALAVTLLWLTTVAATARKMHYDYAYHGKDFASINEDHSILTVCDRESDGHYVVVKGDWGAGRVEVERDGGDAGCDEHRLGLFFECLELCEETKGCNRVHS